MASSVTLAPAGRAVDASFVAAHTLEASARSTAVVVDGIFRPELSNLSGARDRRFILHHIVVVA